MVKLPASKNTALSRIGWATGILCVACCALPLAGVALGSAALAGLAIYSERAAAVVALGGLLALVVRYYVKRRSAPSCDLDCSAGPKRPDGA